jgi:hypothetical protein
MSSPFSRFSAKVQPSFLKFIESTHLTCRERKVYDNYFSNTEGYCYIRLLTSKYRLQAVRKLRDDPALTEVFDLPVYWFHTHRILKADRHPGSIHITRASGFDADLPRNILKALFKCKKLRGVPVGSTTRRVDAVEYAMAHGRFPTAAAVSNRVAADILLSQPNLSISRGQLRAYRTQKFVPSPNVPAKARTATISDASAMASGEILYPSLFEDKKENLIAYKQSFSKFVNTPINPTHKSFRKMAEIFKYPMNYVPQVVDHGEAITARRMWQRAIEENTQYGVVAIVAPSLVEWHANPKAIAWYRDPNQGVDPARVNVPCKMCGENRCLILKAAKSEGRVVTGPKDAAVALFKRFSPDYLVLMNIEPNIASADILYIMESVGIETAYSASHIDWHVLEGGAALDPLTNQHTSIVGQQVLSSFSTSGAYDQSLSNVRSLFSPTVSASCALRRTVLGRYGSSMLMEINLFHGKFVHRFVPDQDVYYLIPVPHPFKGVVNLRIEKKGFDRALQMYRTAAERNPLNARIQLRQSNVTYTVSGSAVTPRLDLSASEFEYLAIWMCVYSTMCDHHEYESLPKTDLSLGTKEAISSVTKGAFSILDSTARKITNAKTGEHTLFGSLAVGRQWLNTMTSNGRYMSLDDISENAYAEVYGKSIALSLSSSSIYKRLANTLHFDAVNSFLDGLTASTWSHGWDFISICTHVSSSVLSLTAESTGVFFDVVIHISRVLNLPIVEAQSKKISTFLSISDTSFKNFFNDLFLAKHLDFQSSCIQIVETFVKHLTPDPAALDFVQQQKAYEARLNVQMMDIPYTRFLTEIKVFLQRYNSRYERFQRIHNLRQQIHAQIELVDPIERAALMRLDDSLNNVAAAVRAAPTLSPNSVPGRSMLTGQIPVTIPVPMMPVNIGHFDNGWVQDGQDTIEQAFERRLIVNVDENSPIPLNQNQPPRFLQRLPTNPDGTVSFQPIHDIMTASNPRLHENFNTIAEIPDILNAQNLYFSPDARGSQYQRNALLRTSYECDRGNLGTQPPFLNRQQLVDQLTTDAAATTINAVSAALVNVQRRLDFVSIPYIAHIEGLAMGGKSQGVRTWVNDQDCIIVPSRELQSQWLRELGNNNATQRVSVYTQHTGLNQNCSRFVIIDEAHTLGIHLLEMYRRFPNAKGLITIGDGGQIKQIFNDQIPQLAPFSHDPLLVFLAPVSFCPYDALYTYLRYSRSAVSMDNYFSGSPICRGLQYEISDELFQPEQGDLVLTCTQAAKARLVNMALPDTITAHESQGSRSNTSWLYSSQANGGCPDFATFSNNSFFAHFGVAITRARQRTIFVCTDKPSARSIPTCEPTGINGTSENLLLSSSYITSGTVFDLVDPTTIPDITFEHIHPPTMPLSDSKLEAYTVPFTLGSLIDPKTNECITVGELKQAEIRVPVDKAKMINTYQSVGPMTYESDCMFNPCKIPGSAMLNGLSRASPIEVPISKADFAKAQRVVDEIFNVWVDKKKFYRIATSSFASIKKQKRSQIVDQAVSNVGARRDAVGHCFPKNEAAKKLMKIGDKEFKTLSVTAMAQSQLSQFTDICDALTKAWCFGLKRGRYSPVGRTRHETATFLGSFKYSWEIDLEKQDSSHNRLLTATFILFLELISQRSGLPELAKEIREARTVTDWAGLVVFMQGFGLGSGDQWTLIANKIMAVSWLVTKYKVNQWQRFLQVGDDITCDRELFPRQLTQIQSQIIKGVKSKLDNHLKDGRPSFTSMASINDENIMLARVRFINNIANKQRDRAMHLAWTAEMGMFRQFIAPFGVSYYAEMHSQLFGTSEPGPIENMIQKAFHISSLKYDDIPESLKAPYDGRAAKIYSRPFGCVGYALAHCVSTNVAAINAIARFSRECTTSETVQACVDNNVPYVLVSESYSSKAGVRCLEKYIATADTRPTMFIFSDHAISVTPECKQSFSFDATTRLNVNLLTEEVSFIDNF